MTIILLATAFLVLVILPAIDNTKRGEAILNATFDWLCKALYIVAIIAIPVAMLIVFPIVLWLFRSSL